MRQLFDEQRRALIVELPVPAANRRDRLTRALALIEDNVLALCEAVGRDHGHQSHGTSMLTEVAPVLSALDTAKRELDAWLRPSKSILKRLMGSDTGVDHQPRGVVGVEVPFTLPISQSLGLLASILAAGNRVMMKFDRATPHVAALLREIGPRYFDATEVAFLPGGEDADAAFGLLPFDLIIRQGATAVAADRVAATHNSKSPVIFGRSADFARAADRLVAAKMVRSGQLPLAPDHLLVPEEAQDEIASWLYRSAAALHPEITVDRDYAPILSDQHHARLLSMVDDARRKGADVLVVNPRDEVVGGANSRKLPLHIIKHATDDMAVMQSEVFGPLLPIRGYRTIDDAIAQVNRAAPPLLLHYYGRDARERRHLLDRALCSAIAIDGEPMRLSAARGPALGAGSLLQDFLGEAGFRALSRMRRVYRPSFFDLKQFATLQLGEGRGAALN